MWVVPARFPAAAWPAVPVCLLCALVGGGPPDLRRCYAPPDLRPPRGLPARSPSAPRASLGASSRSPARPPGHAAASNRACACVPWPCRRPRAPQPHRRPRGGLWAGLVARVRLAGPGVLSVCVLHGWGARMWIGYAHVDRLLRYPDVHYLSGCSLPIRMRSAWRWSACAASFARRVGSKPGQAPQATRRPPGGVRSAGPCDLRRSSFACNSPENVSSFEVGSLIFRGF